MQVCQRCARPLSTNEVGISMRLLGRDGQNLFCRECLAKELKILVELVDKKSNSFEKWAVPCLYKPFRTFRRSLCLTRSI